MITNDALTLLRKGTAKVDAFFRDDQDKAIDHIVSGKGRLLVVQKTGWGKSIVYFIATKLLRDKGSGPTLLISPLLALMRNQILAAERMGLKAVTINSDNTEHWKDIQDAIKRNEVDILLISPERLANEDFKNNVIAQVADKISLLVIDEAHCISDWGHDFRPHYRLIERILRVLPKNLRLLATTATANNRVIEDLKSILGHDLTIMRGDLNRHSLFLQTINMPSQAERLAWLSTYLPNLQGHGIIYTLTVRDTMLIANWLQSRGIDVEAYNSDTGDRRVELEDALLQNKLKALVATTALGMGFDKPDISFVIHYQTPGSVVAYYQQVGRAGRSVEFAYGILLGGEEDTEINDYFINTAFPTRQEVAKVIEVLESSPRGLSMYEILSEVNISFGRLEKVLNLLTLESPSPIIKDGNVYQLTSSSLSEAFWQRAERLTEIRRQEQSQMQEYLQLKSHHMEFLIKALDGDVSNVSPPPLTPLPSAVDKAMIEEAISFLQNRNFDIEPRKLWPVGGLPIYKVKGKIPTELQSNTGKALCVWADAGWGKLVREGKYRDGQFSDSLVKASVSLITKWNPQPTPSWVTCIPSLRHPNLVRDFAERLSRELNLPFYDVLEKTDNRPEQKSMANSILKARNVDGSIAVKTEQIPSGAVLLIDDIVDSRWTFTVAEWLLRSKGSGEVFPFALSFAG